MRLRIGWKATIGLAAIAALAVAVGVAALIGFDRLRRSVDELNENNVTALGHVGRASARYHELLGYLRDALLSTDDEGRERYVSRMSEAEGALLSSLDEFDNAIRADELLAGAQSLRRSLTDLLVERDEILALARQGDAPKAVARLRGGALVTLQQTAGNEVDKLVDKTTAMAAAKVQDADRLVRQGRLGIFGLLALAIAITVVGSAYLLRNVNTIIAQLLAQVRALERAAIAGNLSHRGRPESVDAEFRSVIAGFNATLDAVTGPLRLAVTQMGRIAAGDFPEALEVELHGEFETLRRSLNQGLAALRRLSADTGRLVEAALSGRLDERADSSSHLGDYRRIVEGINQTLSALMDPITEARQVLEALGERRLDVRVLGIYKGDHNIIAANLNLALGNLDDTLSQVAEAAHQVSSAAAQIAEGGQTLATGANRQAEAITEITTSLADVVTRVQQGAQQSGRARALSTLARDRARDGDASMKRMTDAIGRITSSAADTDKILATIEEIASQTNLLALNAAVEAARAGDAGRAFAVVATEVRELATRSSEAAKKTAALVKQARTNAEEGVVVSGEVGQALAAITAAATEVSGLVDALAVEARSQSAALEAVNGRVANLDAITQGNAAVAEESSSASEQLAAQAQGLADLVARFTLSEPSTIASALEPARQPARG